MSNIGFIGLGNMGFPMAQNLAKEKQNNIYVFDRNLEKEFVAGKRRTNK